MSTADFYLSLKRFKEFERLSEISNFTEVPADWYVVLTDVAGSTKAIENGRYQDVNMLGASCIAAVEEVFGGLEFPFVFGGDGATFLVPMHKLDEVTIGLSRLKSFATTQYQLELRVGVISVQEIKRAGQSLEIAKYELCGARSIAMFRGGGLSYAESQIKSFPDRYCLTSDVTEKVDGFKGLSCRWQPIPSKQGKVLSILVQPQRMDSLETLGEIVQELAKIFGGSIEKANPVQQRSMRYKGFIGTAIEEFRLHEKRMTRKYLSRLFGLAVSVWVLKLKLPSRLLPSDYTGQISSHSDFRKFDDTLRLIVDASQAQHDEIRECLMKHYAKSEIFFGIHESTHALMTCLVGKPTVGGHIHFIDGSDGGYALAAKSMKSQIADKKNLSAS